MIDDAQVPQTQPSQTARQWAMFCHFAAFLGLVFPFGNLLGPLIVWQVKREARERLHQPPSRYLRRFWYDCLTHSEPALRFLIDTVGADRVVFGTDWPADMMLDWPVTWILEMTSLTDEEKELILWRNLERLLDLPPVEPLPAAAGEPAAGAVAGAGA